MKNYKEQGGDKNVIGGELEIAIGGKLTFNGVELKPSETQAESKATTVVATVNDLNALINKLKDAGLMKS